MGKLCLVIGAAAIGAAIGYFFVQSNWSPFPAPEEGLRNGTLVGAVIGGLCGAFGAGQSSKN